MALKVLMFGWEFPPFNSGGLGIACQGLTQALAEQNVDITFVLPKRVPLSTSHMRLVFADDSLSTSWPAYSPYSTAAQNGGLNGLPGDLASIVQMYAKCAPEIAKKYSCDVIHAHDWLCFPAGVAASLSSSTPLVSHVHATEFDRCGGSCVNPHVFGVERQGISSSSEVIAVSQFTKNLLTRYYSAPEDKVNVVHNGINADEYIASAYSPDPLLELKRNGFKIVLYVGRITMQKGVDYFIKAAHQVLSFHPNTIFLVSGSGDMQNQIIDLTASLGISDHVLFAGFLRGEELKQAYRAADLFVMPSVSEPFGITALESVASGTPALISKQSGVSETLSHVLKVDFWDIEDMANKIVSVLYYPSLKQTLSANGRQESKANSWKKAASKTIKVYEKVLSNKN